MAKRVVVSRQELELTDEEAKQFILNNVLNGIGHSFMLNSFLGRIQAAGLESSNPGTVSESGLGALVNELLKEGKLCVEYDYIGGPMGGPGGVWIIKRVQ